MRSHKLCWCTLISIVPPLHLTMNIFPLNSYPWVVSSSMSPFRSCPSGLIHLCRSVFYSGFLSLLIQLCFLTPTLADTLSTLQPKLLQLFLYVFLGTHFVPLYSVLPGTAMWQCATITFSHICFRKTNFTLHWSRLPPLHPPPDLYFSFSSSVTLFLSSLYLSPLRCFILYLVFTLSSPIVFCLGMLATLELYSSMHFISIFISDFVIIYSLVYLGLSMHAVCETDSCIYQWNRVRS